MKSHADFETRSAVDLKSQGLDRYSSDESTGLICLAYKIEDGETKLWHPDLDLPYDYFHFIREGGKVYAHNAQFEHTVWNRVGKKYGFPTLPLEQTYCNLAMALACGYPGQLEKLAEAMNLKIKKDMTGNRIMLQLSRPRKILDDGTIIWWDKKEVPEKYEATYKYCITDVEVEYLTHKNLIELSPQERQVWLLDQKINMRGIGIDVKGAETTQKLLEDNAKDIEAKFREVSKGEIAKNSPKQIVDFLEKRGMKNIGGVTKGEVEAYLSRPDIPEDCKEILHLRQEASKSSTAKISAMLERVVNGRVRFIAQYHGAGTGRWAGRGIQVQNFPRPNIDQEEIEEILDRSIYEGAEYVETFHGSLSTSVSNCLRGYLKAEEGKTLIDMDWANIEGRVMAWLADEAWKVKAFEDFDKGIGADIYMLSYATSFRINLANVTKPMRQIGKVLELSMQYQGGVGAFQSMATNYGVRVTDEKANELKNAWREVHPNIVKYWYELERAAIKALQTGEVISVGPKDHRAIKFKKHKQFLVCRLPSGRCLYYVNPELEMRSTPWGDNVLGVSYYSEDSMTKKWKKHHLYGGLLAENIVQAVARDILAETLIRLEDNNFPTVMHVHDEIVCEIDKTDQTEIKLKEMQKLMTTLPTWAKGLPIASEGWHGERYRKD